MNLILASDFPADPLAPLVDRLRAAHANPRIAFIPTHTDGAAFDAARKQFAAVGFEALELVDIDLDRDEVQIAYLHEFDVVFLGDGDALRLRFNALRSGLSGRLRQCVSAGRLIVGSGAGAMLLTPNVSLSRLNRDAVDAVIETRDRFDALGAVRYELLPHALAGDALFLEKVRNYSARVLNDIVLLSDAGAIFPTGPATFEHVGQVTRYRAGAIIEQLT